MNQDERLVETPVTVGRRFNINHHVKVRLTERGHQYLRETDQAWKLTPGHSTAEEADGWSSWQLWDLAATFGGALGNGMMVPFETEILIVDD